LKKIVAIGPESTGKSTLCEQLADHYKTSWCPEYAREYLLKQGKKYNYEDLFAIATGQLGLEESCVQLAIGNMQNAIFIDTDMYVMKVWCEFVFGKCHRFILDQIVERKYDLYLLCNTDLPWTPDEFREYPDPETRHKLFLIYKDILMNQETPWIEVAGLDPDRLNNTIAAIDDFLINNPGNSERPERKK